MEERDKRRVGEQIEPGGRPKAPGRLELLQRFVNSYNHDFPPDWDRLGTTAKAEAWLRQKRLVAPADRISEAEAVRLRELREAIRALAIANQEREPDPAATDVVRQASRAA
ncbi:MAG TPA: ABATE domain-containing protein, partial [Thermoleophilaceae bacterium]|nr:ABATE domain-containing protein [Thermoleophilaceae bacterium]